MQVRLPVVVIGGGLTAIDTATESLAYYPVQVEKFLARYETLVAEARRGGGARGVDAEEAAIADEFLAHARAHPRGARGRRARRPAAARSPSCCSSWGGVTIAYRRRMIDSPAYTLNHEEIEKALEEGIRFAEGPDAAGSGGRRARPRHARWPCRSQRESGRRRAWHERDGEHCRRAPSSSPPARSPTPCSRARTPSTSTSTARYFRLLDEDGAAGPGARGHGQAGAAGGPHRSREDGRAVSFFGDLHPSFAATSSRRWRRQAGLPGGRRAMLARIAPAIAARAMRAFFAPLDDALRATRRARRSASRRPSSRSWCTRPPPRGAFQPGPVLPAAELRDACAARRRHAAGDGRPRAHRRLGRPRTRASSRRSCWRWAARRTCAPR